MISKNNCQLLTALIFSLFFLNGYSLPAKKPLIFPIPSDVQLGEGKFTVDKNTFLLLPQNPNKADDLLTKFFHSKQKK